MKKGIAILFTGMMTVLGSAAMADNEWGVFGTYWSPSDGDGTFGGGVKLGIEMVDQVQLDIRYSIFSDVLGDGPKLDVDPLEAGLSFSVPTDSDFQPYFGAGLGYYLMSGNADDEVGFYLSGGVEYILHRSGADYGETTTKLFLEGMYRFVDASIGEEDLDLNGPGVQLGLMIGW